MSSVLVVISFLFPTPNTLRKKWSLSYKWRSGVSVTGKLTPHRDFPFEHCNQVVDWQEFIGVFLNITITYVKTYHRV